MTGIMLDYTSRIAPSALLAANVEVVSRYLSWLPNPKVIQKAEYDELRAAGIRVVLNWEYSARDWTSGAPGARLHVAEAVRQARALGHDDIIIYSADFNMSGTDWYNGCNVYANVAANDTLSAGMRPGVYGPYDVLGWCQAQTGMEVFWQCMSTSFSGGRNAKQWPNVDAWQKRGMTVGGVSTDISTIIQEGTFMALTQQDLQNIANAVWNQPIGGPLHKQEAHYQLSDLSDQVVRGKSSYDGGTYGPIADLVTLVKAGGFTVPQINAIAKQIADILIASNTNSIPEAEHAAIVRDMESALNSGRLTFGPAAA